MQRNFWKETFPLLGIPLPPWIWQSHPYGLEVFLVVISICFTHFLAICMISLNESLVESFAHFESGYCSPRVRTSLCVLDINQ